MNWLTDRIRNTPASELVLWGSILFTIILLITTGGFLFRTPAPPANPAPAPPTAAQQPPFASVDAQPTAQLTTDPPTVASIQTAVRSEPASRLPVPTITAPPGGTVIELLPTAQDVGWVRQQDTTPNHFGDYNIYAGSFDGLEHIGAIRFDLSAVPAGADITYADLILSGLTEEWLHDEGTWQVELLKPWMGDNWSNKSYPELQRDDGMLAAAGSPLQATDLSGQGFNMLVLDSTVRSALEDNIFAGQAIFRVQGPATEADNLFSWDSGYGTDSRGHAPVLRLAVGPAPQTPPASPTPDYVIITAVPQPRNVLTAAANNLTATAHATPYTSAGTPTPSVTPTPIPPNWVTPVVVVPTDTPGNTATAAWRNAIGTAEAIVHGTPTPFPPNAWTATPKPTATVTPVPTQIPLLIPVEQLTPEAEAATPTATPATLPSILSGRIGYLSDRMDPDRASVFIYDPATGATALLTDRWAYQRATELDTVAPNGSEQLFVQQYESTYEIWALNLQTGVTRYITGRGQVTYDPAWSPDGSRIAFVSQVSGNDEIYTRDLNTGDEMRLTNNTWEWDKHPSWSPDGSQIVFWSNRDSGQRQVWIMNADGTQQRPLFSGESNGWDPVWFK
jgi:hypothetical protein